MALCATCGRVILFGGTKAGTLRFCNKKCEQRSGYAAVAQSMQEQLPDDVIEPHVNELHQGSCPCCGGHGPVDFHESYRCLSFLVITQFQTFQQLSCSDCAVAAKWKNMFLTLFFGWWGIPFGIILTPLYVGKNLYRIMFPTPPGIPSERLREYVRTALMTHVLKQQGE